MKASTGILSVAIVLTAFAGAAFYMGAFNVHAEEPAAVAVPATARAPATPSPVEAPAPVAAEAPAIIAVDEKCPAFAITGEVSKDNPRVATFTVAPARDGLQYSWTLSAGAIVSGQGTASIMVDNPNAGDVITALDILGLDASCPKDSGYATATVKMP